ncbi:winged helix DNA-binding domain-containing protein [uncultured Kocuria sp.]|uniref:winged helix DNA-binding domain-containing protein n=1 Tax=uncultured Kocuria sp. TaxID=259305 RepID=UPI0025996FF9|nr:winged helix DNA-binding domain-containing protein [uncultured Kocuria sp.]MCT1367225.1 winged helix DNA-binding domain-containing protein [Rothia sp. p3-SID1597]
MRRIDDEERRARLARRHGIAPEHRHSSLTEAVHGVLALHATEPATPHLSLHARVDGLMKQDVETALYKDRTLVRQLAMRRTLFAFPREFVPAALGAPSARVATTQYKRLVKEIAATGAIPHPEAWLESAREAVLAFLSGGREHQQSELRALVPEISGTMTVNAGTKYEAESHIAPRLVTWMGAEGDIVRAHGASHWRVNRFGWARMDEWLGSVQERPSERDSYKQLVEAYLRGHGPATERDLTWWFGSTKSAMRRALADVEAVEVQLERGATGWVLPDDVEPVDPVDPWAALLPALDPASLGWKDRDFYLDADFSGSVYDWAGNPGTTAWWDGRIVGSFVQDAAGVVELILGSDPGRVARRELENQARRLEEWLDGERVTAIYKAPITKGRW